MVRKIGLLAGLLAASTFLWGAGKVTGGSAPGPASRVQVLLKEVKRLSEARQEKEKVSISREISTYFDLQEICRVCLGKTWDGLSAEERQSFVSLFRELLETVAYPKSSDFFTGTQVEVQDAVPEGARVQVETEVEHPDEGLVEVTFCMGDSNGTWLVQDIHLDGVSLVIDLRSQMQKILKEDSYVELKRRMREKLEED